MCRIYVYDLRGMDSRSLFFYVRSFFFLFFFLFRFRGWPITPLFTLSSSSREGDLLSVFRVFVVPNYVTRFFLLSFFQSFSPFFSL